MAKKKKRDFNVDDAIALFDSLGIEAFGASPHHLGLVHCETGTRYDWYWNKGSLLTFPDGSYGCRKLAIIFDVEEISTFINHNEYKSM